MMISQTRVSDTADVNYESDSFREPDFFCALSPQCSVLALGYRPCPDLSLIVLSSLSRVSCEDCTRTWSPTLTVG